jgi:hypothetical protein
VLLIDKSLGDFAKTTEATRQGLAANFLPLPTAPTSTTEVATSTPVVSSTPEVVVTSTPVVEEEPVLGVVLSEVYPQPNTGEVEFVELYNPNDNTVDLAGWYLVEGGGSQTVVTGTIAAQSFLKIAPIKGSLNNTGDEVQLWHGDNKVDGVAYGEWDGSVLSPTKGQSVVRENLEIIGEWKLGNPTPGAVNSVILETLETEEENDDSEGGAVVKNVTGKLKINEIFPDTVGADVGEFVEIINPTTVEVAMSQWRLEVGEQEYVLPDQVVLPGAIVVFYREKSKLVLPNFKKRKSQARA